MLSIKAMLAKEDITRKNWLLSALPKLSRPGNLVFFRMSKQCFVRMTENSTNDGCNVIVMMVILMIMIMMTKITKKAYNYHYF